MNTTTTREIGFFVCGYFVGALVMDMVYIIRARAMKPVSVSGDSRQITISSEGIRSIQFNQATGEIHMWADWGEYVLARK